MLSSANNCKSSSVPLRGVQAYVSPLILVDNFQFRIDIARMLRRALALLLVLSWFVLATVDVSEDLAVCRQNQLNACSGTGALANDIVESADTSCGCVAWVSDLAIYQLFAFTWTSSPRTSKLHKLHHIYQI